MTKNKKTTNKPYWVYGKHAVISALKNPNRVKELLMITTSTLNEISSEIDLKSCGVKYQVAIPNDFSKILGGSDIIHQGIALKTERLEPLDLKDLILSLKSKSSSLLIALDQVTDPHNLGAILRSAAAFSVDAVIVPSNNSALENSTVVKAASGAIDTVNLVQVVNLSQTIEKLKKENFWVVGMDGLANDHISTASKFEKILLVLGSEGEGMKRLTRENCDLLVKIPISSNMESLNVSNAAAIAMYALSK